MAVHNPTAEDMAEYLKWDALLQNTYQNGPMPAAPDALPGAVTVSPTTPAGTRPANIPGAPGLVYLTGLPEGSYYATKAFAIDEVGRSYAPGSPEQLFVECNVAYANSGELAFDPDGKHPFELACRPIHQVGAGWSVNMGLPSIDGTLACPSTGRMGPELETVAKATAYLSTLPNPVTGGSGGFGHT